MVGWPDATGNVKDGKMLKEWMEDIRVKTEHMNQTEKRNYILTYYWPHMLLGLAAIGLILLLVYHIGWGDQKKEFTLVLVNQKIDFERDNDIRMAFSAASGISNRRVLVDSDYQISYDAVSLKDVNESSYEKFFFNWSVGTIDAVVMPESFYHYCIRQGGEFAVLTDMEDVPDPEACFVQNGQCCGIYVKHTALAACTTEDGQDPLIVVFPLEMHHPSVCGQFLAFLQGVDGQAKGGL